MFVIDLATGNILDSSGEFAACPIRFTGNQLEKFDFSFVKGTEQYRLPENCQIVMMGDVAEHYNTPAFISFGTISPDRCTAEFEINTSTEEYAQRVRASNTPCFADIVLYAPETSQYKRLVRIHAIADKRLDAEGRPPEPLKKYYTKEEIEALINAGNFNLTVSEVKAIMLEYGESPYANMEIVNENDLQKLNFTIAVPAGKPGIQGIQGEKGSDGKTPQRGVDYWTDTDVAEIKEYVNNAIVNGEW